MGDPDIQRAIEIIDKKIQSLQQARNQLAQAFGIMEQISEVSEPIPQRPRIVRTVGAPDAPAFFPQQRPRKEALAEFLIQNGPMPRADIVAGAGLPEGTISYCLSDKRFFEQRPNGDWDVTEFSRNGFKLKAQGGSSVALPPMAKVLP